MFQDFKDEVLDPSLQPDTNPRYTIKDNNGKVISDNVQIDMKTPVVQNPTPLNRANIRNLQGDLYTQDRYNTPSYSGTAMTLDLPLTSYEAGKVIKIKAPATLTNPTLNINGLGAKTINGMIESSKKYELVYNGNSFDVYSETEFKIFTNSGTQYFSKGVYYVILVGGGGGGGYYRGENVGGGGGGAIIHGIVSFPQETSIQLTIGAGGDVGSSSSYNGGTGGTTSLSGGNYSVNAGGGSGGIEGSYVTPGDGGTATIASKNYGNFWSKEGTKGTGDNTYSGGLNFLGQFYGRGGKGNDEKVNGATAGESGVVIFIKLSN